MIIADLNATTTIVDSGDDAEIRNESPNGILCIRKWQNMFYAICHRQRGSPASKAVGR